VARPVRIEPERVERVDLVLRADRVDGVRPDRAEPVRVDGLAAGVAAVVAPPAAAIPHVSQ
jgi:hypothetical protein